MSELVQINEALKSENASLKDIIDRLNAQNRALSETVHQIADGNVNFKAAGYLLEKQLEKVLLEKCEKDRKISDLQNQLDELKKKLETPDALPDAA